MLPSLDFKFHIKWTVLQFKCSVTDSSFALTHSRIAPGVLASLNDLHWRS